NYAEFRHALLAHGPEMDGAQRTRAAMEFDSELLAAASGTGSGTLPARKSFVRVLAGNVIVSAFRKRAEGYELRLLEVAGKPATPKVEFGFNVSRVEETDLHGRVIGKPIASQPLSLQMKPWQFRTFRIV